MNVLTRLIHLTRFARRSRYLALSLLLSHSVLSTSASAEVIISEIMYNPQGSPDDNHEWVEIYNTGDSVIDIGGWTLEDIQDNGQVSTAVPTGVLLQPKQALVLTENSTVFDQSWGGGINRLELGSFPPLANSPSPTNETVAIRDHLGVIRDQVNFSNIGDWPDLVGSDGESIYVRPGALSSTLNDSGSSWLPSMTGLHGAYFMALNDLSENHGSPGYVETQLQSPFAPSPDAVWSIAIIPDTQNYVKNSAQAPILSEMTQWIKEQREAFGIQVVLHEGDLVNNNNAVAPNSGDQTSAQQWQHVKNAFSLLDDHVPYILSTGNHDHGFFNSENRDTELNRYFSLSDNSLVDPAEGGILKGVHSAGELHNAYFEFTAPDGRDMLVVSLEWAPRPQVVAWANQIVSQSKYEDYTAVLLTHAYTYHDNTRWELNPSTYPAVADGKDGEDLWGDFVALHENFEFVFSGHVGGDGLGYLASEGFEGNLVHQMLFNTQFEANGGAGWIRILEFLEDGRSVRIRTYSPHYDLQKTDSDNSFLVTASQIPIFTADLDSDGDVDAADLGFWTSAYATAELGDTDSDGDSDGIDFLTWQLQYGLGVMVPLHTIPEPSSLLLMVIAVVLQSRKYCCEMSR